MNSALEPWEFEPAAAFRWFIFADRIRDDLSIEAHIGKLGETVEV
jgi:hypothetical protein